MLNVFSIHYTIDTKWKIADSTISSISLEGKQNYVFQLYI